MQDWPEGRMVAVVGDAELDEGNIYECLLECWKHRLRNCWWVIDYNRQSLDALLSLTACSPRWPACSRPWAGKSSLLNTVMR